jgi:hypothetical protein
MSASVAEAYKVVFRHEGPLNEFVANHKSELLVRLDHKIVHEQRLMHSLVELV